MSDAVFPPAFAAGVRHFNAGEYFEAHEAFEECLDAVEEDERWDLLVALIQVAVGYHKLASGNAGAARMLSLGAEKLAAFPGVAWGVQVAALRERALADAAALEAGGASAPSFRDDPPRVGLVS
jgi:predicted metal-dependent hydrolase